MKRLFLIAGLIALLMLSSVFAGASSWQAKTKKDVGSRDKQTAEALLKEVSPVYGELFNFKNFIGSTVQKLKDCNVPFSGIEEFIQESYKAQTPLQNAQGNYFMGWLWYKPASFKNPDYKQAVTYLKQSRSDYQQFKGELQSLALFYNALTSNCQSA